MKQCKLVVYDDNYAEAYRELLAYLKAYRAIVDYKIEPGILRNGTDTEDKLFTIIYKEVDRDE